MNNFNIEVILINNKNINQKDLNGQTALFHIKKIKAIF